MIRPTIDEITRLLLARRHFSIPSLLLAIASSEQFHISIYNLFVCVNTIEKGTEVLVNPPSAYFTPI
jgi:hypothetical protein